MDPLDLRPTIVAYPDNGGAAPNQYVPPNPFKVLQQVSTTAGRQATNSVLLYALGGTQSDDQLTIVRFPTALPIAQFPTALEDAPTATLYVIDITGHGATVLEASLSAVEKSLGRGMGAVSSQSTALFQGLDQLAAAYQFNKPLPTRQNVADSMSSVLELVAVLNRASLNRASKLAAKENRTVKVSTIALLIADPAANPPRQCAKGDVEAEFVYIETVDRLNRAFFRELLHVLSMESIGELVMSGRLFQIAPSLWGNYSPQNFEPFKRLNHPDTEFVTVETSATFGSFVTRLFSGEAADGFYGRNLIYGIRLCRRMATQSLEGEPFDCTVVFVSDGNNLSQIPRDKPFEKDGRKLRWCLKFEPTASFLFTDEHAFDHFELIQSEGSILFVDLKSLAMIGICGHWHSGDYYRCTSLRSLANSFNAVIAHIQGGRHVELYDDEANQLWYDGFSWTSAPFHLVTFELMAFFKDSDLVRRVVGAIVGLMDLKASSILAFVDNVIDLPPDLEVNLTDLRRSVQSSLQGTPSSIKNVRLTVLVGFLKIDGIHFISKAGDLVWLGRSIVPVQNAGGYAGTGRVAAKRLSELIGENGLVIKVSSSGKLYVFKDDVELYDQRQQQERI